MKKIILFLCVLSPHLFGLGLNARVGFYSSAIGSSIYKIEQPIGASLIIGNNSGSSLTVWEIVPQTWVTVGGSSTVSWSPPHFDVNPSRNIVPANSEAVGGSLYFSYPAIFHAPSINPSFSGNSLVKVGTQTYSISVLVNGSDGSTVAAIAPAVVEIDPLTLPSAEVTGVVK